MNETQLYEALGRKQIAFENLRGEYLRLLEIARGLAAGTIAGSRFSVTGPDSWRLEPEAAQAAEAPAE